MVAKDTGVRVEKVQSAIVLTIDRPASANALDLGAAQALGAAVRAAETEPGVRAVVVTGAGDRFFCSGGDLKAYQAIATPAELERTFGTVRKLLDQFESSSLPVIAAINGYALGGGLELALACDIRIAHRGARLGIPQARLGLIPGWNGTERLVETVGRAKAMHLLLSGARLEASRAEAIGLIDFVAGGSALQAAVDYAADLEKCAPLAVRASKQAVIGASRGSRSEVGELTAALFERLWFSKDHREAEHAFIEKRAPRFVGE